MHPTHSQPDEPSNFMGVDLEIRACQKYDFGKLKQSRVSHAWVPVHIETDGMLGYIDLCTHVHICYWCWQATREARCMALVCTVDCGGLFASVASSR